MSVDQSYTISQEFNDGVERVTYSPKEKKYSHPLLLVHGMALGVGNSGKNYSRNMAGKAMLLASLDMEILLQINLYVLLL